MQRLAKPVVFVAALLPALWLAFRTYTGRLSANPIEDLTLTTGIWALRLLVITLAITPMRRITGWNRLIQYRRMLGLFTFFYAFLHFAVWLTDRWLDPLFGPDLIFDDIAKRPFITMGMIAFVLMVPLAMTSTKGSIRRLGRRWIAAASAHLHQRHRRGDSLPVEGEGGDRLSGLLRAHRRGVARVPGAMDAAETRRKAAGQHQKRGPPARSDCPFTP